MYKKGYSVLLIVIIISAVGAVFAFSTLVTSTQVAKTNISLTSYTEEFSTARSCTEKVMSRLKAYKFYGGDETLEDGCRVFSISGIGNIDRIIQVRAGDVFLETKIKQINPTLLVEYQKNISREDIDSNNPYIVDPLALRLWLKADNAEGNNGQAIFSLKNSTDDLIDFAQVTNTTLAPKLITNAINNRPALRFDGIDDFLTSTNTSIHTENGLSVIAVGKVNSASTNQTYIAKFDETDIEKEWRLQNDEFNVVNNTLTFTDNTDLRILTALWSPISPQLSVAINNTTATTATGATSITATTEPIIIGANLQGGAGFLSGDIAEILVYNKKLDTTELNKIITYMNSKYNVY